MKAKRNQKLLIGAVCVILLLAIAVVGTVAYFTSQDAVTNTFTFGKIAITLDEAKVDVNGTPVTPASRVKSNTYKLTPSHVYTKDPVVHVDADSEDAWIFIKVANGIASVEAAANNIDAQIKANGWTELTAGSGIYYCTYTKGQAKKDLPTFTQFKVAETATETDLAPLANAKLDITAYAIQKDNLASASAAWAAFGG